MVASIQISSLRTNGRDYLANVRAVLARRWCVCGAVSSGTAWQQWSARGTALESPTPGEGDTLIIDTL